MISVAMTQWAEDHGTQPEFIKPGKPMQNGYIERFNRTYRDEVAGFICFLNAERSSGNHGRMDCRVQPAASS
jgi:transposase InsO family protein